MQVAPIYAGQSPGAKGTPEERAQVEALRKLAYELKRVLEAREQSRQRGQQPPARAGIATARSTNFVAHADSQEGADNTVAAAEHYRKEKALEWLGREMPPWPIPCEITVERGQGGGGYTSFAFDGGRCLSQSMKIVGDPESLGYSVLPHEVTHTVFANHFGQPLPRWADEGGAVLSESQKERDRHDRIMYEEVTSKPQYYIPLARLMPAKEYPAKGGPALMAFYAEGYSLTAYLVAEKGRREFLAYVGDGMRHGWEQATVSHYGRSVSQLEGEWRADCRLFPNLRKRLGGTQPPPPTTPALPTTPGGSPDLPASPTPASPAPDLAGQLARLERIERGFIEIKELIAKVPAGAKGEPGKDGAPGLAGPPGKDADPARIAALEQRIAELQRLIEQQPARPQRVRVVPADQ